MYFPLQCAIPLLLLGPSPWFAGESAKTSAGNWRILAWISWAAAIVSNHNFQARIGSVSAKAVDCLFEQIDTLIGNKEYRHQRIIRGGYVVEIRVCQALLLKSEWGKHEYLESISLHILPASLSG